MTRTELPMTHDFFLHPDYFDDPIPQLPSLKAGPADVSDTDVSFYKIDCCDFPEVKEITNWGNDISNSFEPIGECKLCLEMSDLDTMNTQVGFDQEMDDCTSFPPSHSALRPSAETLVDSKIDSPSAALNSDDDDSFLGYYSETFSAFIESREQQRRKRTLKMMNDDNQYGIPQENLRVLAILSESQQQARESMVDNEITSKSCRLAPFLRDEVRRTARKFGNKLKSFAAPSEADRRPEPLSSSLNLEPGYDQDPFAPNSANEHDPALEHVTVLPDSVRTLSNNNEATEQACSLDEYLQDPLPEEKGGGVSTALAYLNHLSPDQVAQSSVVGSKGIGVRNYINSQISSIAHSFLRNGLDNEQYSRALKALSSHDSCFKHHSQDLFKDMSFRYSQFRTQLKQMTVEYAEEWNSPANSSVRLLLAECPGSQMLNELQRDFKICFFRDGAQSLFQSLRSHGMASIADESEILYREYCDFQEEKRNEKPHIPTHSIAHSLVAGMAIGAQLIVSLRSLLEFSKCESVGKYLICCQAIQEFLDAFNHACWIQKTRQRILPVKVAVTEPLDYPF